MEVDSISDSPQPMEVDSLEDSREKWKKPQGHVDLLFEMLSPHVPDAITNVIFLFELSLPRDENAHMIKLEGEDVSSLSESQFSSLQFGDTVIKPSYTTSPTSNARYIKILRQWMFTYSLEKRKFLLQEYHPAGLPFEYTRYVIGDPIKRTYWYSFLIHLGEEDRRGGTLNQSCSSDLKGVVQIGEEESQIKKSIEKALGFTINETIKCRFSFQKRVADGNGVRIYGPTSLIFSWPKGGKSYPRMRGVIKSPQINRLFDLGPEEAATESRECDFSFLSTKPVWHGIKIPADYSFQVKMRR